MIIQSDAQAWVKVAPADRKNFVDTLVTFGKSRGYSTVVRDVPGEWPMVMVRMTHNRGTVINAANATEEINYSIAVFRGASDEEWSTDWRDLRSQVATSWQWQEVPSTSKPR